MKLEHRLKFRVYYSDTDAGGVVYYANYAKFFEQGRTEFLHSHKLSPQVIMEKYHLLLPVIHLSIDYQQPAYYDEQLILITRLQDCTRVRLHYTYEVIRSQGAESQEDIILTRGETVNVAVDKLTMRPRRLPRELVAIFSS